MKIKVQPDVATSFFCFLRFCNTHETLLLKLCKIQASPPRWLTFFNGVIAWYAKRIAYYTEEPSSRDVSRGSLLFFIDGMERRLN